MEIEGEKASKAEATILESPSAEVKVDVGNLEIEALQEKYDSLEKGAEEPAAELQVKTPTEDVPVFEDTVQVDVSVSEATDASEAETSVTLEATSDTEQELKLNDELVNQNAGTEAAEQEGNEVEVPLGTLESKSPSETSNCLKKEAAVVAIEKRMETAEETTTKEMHEALNIDPLSLPEVDPLAGDVQTEALVEELLFNVPGHIAGARGITEEAVTADVLDGKFNSCESWRCIRYLLKNTDIWYITGFLTSRQMQESQISFTEFQSKNAHTSARMQETTFLICM